MSSGLSEDSLFTATNKLEITAQSYGDLGTAFQGGTRVAVWNQREPTRHLAFSSWSGLLHTAEHNGKTRCLIVEVVKGWGKKKKNNKKKSHMVGHVKSLGNLWKREFMRKLTSMFRDLKESKGGIDWNSYRGFAADQGYDICESSPFTAVRCLLIARERPAAHGRIKAFQEQLRKSNQEKEQN